MRTRTGFFSSMLRARPIPDENPVALGNRIATQSDRTLYGNFITVGDLIMDSWTKVNPDGSHNATYFFMALSWPQLAGEPTIWFDGDLLCPDGEVLNEIKFQSGTEPLNIPWSVNKVTFKTIPGTKIYTKNFICHGLLDWVLEGEGAISPWPASRKFLHGIFSFNIVQRLTVSSHGIVGSVRDGGSIELSGFEIQHGFSGVRLMTAQSLKVVASLKIYNFYIHDTRSEGLYIGMTTGPPIPVFRNVQIYNGIIARSGTEPIQLQNFQGSDIHHITVFAADTAWKHPFQNFQSAAIQWSCNGGINKLRNIIINGFALNGLMVYSPHVVDGHIFYSELFNECVASDLAFFQGRSTGSYTHNFAAGNGINWIFRDCAWSHFNDTFADYTGASNIQFIITKGNLMTDVMTVENLVHDGSKPVVIETPANWNVSGTILDPARPLPVHINDGFDNHPERVSEWHQFYAPWLDENNNNPLVPTHWLLDEIAMWINVATERYEFYPVTTEHDSTADEPPNSPNFGPKLTWDTAGVRSDKPGFNAGSVQSDYPPDNLGLVGSTYAHLGCQIDYE